MPEGSPHGRRVDVGAAARPAMARLRRRRHAARVHIPLPRHPGRARGAAGRERQADGGGIEGELRGGVGDDQDVASTRRGGHRRRG